VAARHRCRPLLRKRTLTHIAFEPARQLALTHVVRLLPVAIRFRVHLPRSSRGHRSRAAASARTHKRTCTLPQDRQPCLPHAHNQAAFRCTTLKDTVLRTASRARAHTVLRTVLRTIGHGLPCCVVNTRRLDVQRRGGTLHTSADRACTTPSFAQVLPAVLLGAVLLGWQQTGGGAARSPPPARSGAATAVRSRRLLTPLLRRRRRAAAVAAATASAAATAAAAPQPPPAGRRVGDPQPGYFRLQSVLIKKPTAVDYLVRSHGKALPARPMHPGGEGSASDLALQHRTAELVL